MQTSEKKVWFPAKKYGWGWSLPCSWEGWVVLAIYIILAAAGTGLLTANGRAGLGFAFIVALSGVFCSICWIKGERPRWRWGDTDEK